MCYSGTPVDFTELEATFRRVSSKIESALIPDEITSRRLIWDAQDLASVQRNFKARLDKIIHMFYHSRGVGEMGNRNYLHVFAVSQAGLAVLKAALMWFTEKQREMEVRVNHILVFKYQRLAKRNTKGSDIDEPSKGKMATTSDRSTKEFAGKSDKNPNKYQATAPLENLVVPWRRLADRLELSVVSDDDWEPIEGILAKSSELSVALAILLVELYVQLLPREREEGMYVVLDLLQYLDELAIENSRREMVKWISHAVKVGEEELRHLEIVADPPGKSDADEVHFLVGKFTRIISELEDLNDFGRLSGSGLTANEALMPLTEQLNSIEIDINDIDKQMAKRWIKLYHGVWAPVILCLMNRIGMCFKRRFYRGKLW